ncbi:alpha/beta fold hydrolase [Pseudonocardia asaccharolytica]|uniref:Alpha/beta hydrolase n=1 Tax=Pseudonocardia asaccharolytica DSM 44247 = NBRC 16224 TaxID=1123024 RepID=A0A511D0J7_9PSEU|nr:alpha/beta hydrolase [Pseudonocardia asaccharolytica]GEL18063.1 alpha/beta hydrolase [Pseudonocardia asaccharolytica DSM 44247 = NBRC 16224]
MSDSRLPLIELNGSRYEYEDVGGGFASAPLLFLHEGLGSVGLWRGFHRRIAAASGRRAVAYSRLGHGFSDLPPSKRTPSFMHEEAAQVVSSLMAALDLPEPVLVGHSDGASIALLVAAALPVRGLVVMAPHVFVESHGLDGIVAARTAYLEGDLRTRMARHHRDPDVTFWNWNDVWLDPRFRDWDITAELAGIRCPVLGVQGDADRYGSMAHVEAVRDRAGGPVELLALSCGHSPHLECPEATEKVVTEFLRSLG